MMNTTFLHVADIHLDSPLAHLRRLDSNAASRLQRASRRSLETIIASALEHRVAAVVIAGDLFDAPVKDAGAGLWVESQFKRLTREGIKIVLIRGNHDALSNARRVIRWSDSIHELGADKPETLLLDDAGLAIHGQSFGARVVIEDLAANYPAAEAGYFNIGLLHTSLSGSAQHDTYAPTTVASLEGKGYQYWALGHIHLRSQNSLSSKCFIGYSGNTQGRHIRESGAKGCQLVKVRDAQLDSVQFIPTDSLRWHEVRSNIEAAEFLSDIEDLVQEQVGALVETAQGRPLALRVHLEGATSLHAELTKSVTRARLGDSLASRLSDFGDIWLESVKIASRPPTVVSTDDDMRLPLKYLCQVADKVREDAVLQSEMMDVLEELLRKARVELSAYDWPLAMPDQQPAELQRLLRQAEDLLIARLITQEAE